MKRKFTRYPKSSIKASSSLGSNIEKLTLDGAIASWQLDADYISYLYDMPSENVKYFYWNPNWEGDECTGIETFDGRYFVAYGGHGGEIVEVNSLSEVLDEIEKYAM